MLIPPVLSVSLLFIYNICGVNADEKPYNQTMARCVPAPVLICTKNDGNLCVGPKLLLISSPIHGDLTFELESITSTDYLRKPNATHCIFTGKMNETSNQVSVNTCFHSLNNSNLVICLVISNNSWSIDFNQSKECYQIQSSQCSIQGITPIDKLNILKPDNFYRTIDPSLNHLFDSKFLISTPRYVQIGFVIDCTSVRSTVSNDTIIDIFKKGTQLLKQMNIFPILSFVMKLDGFECREAIKHAYDTRGLLTKFGEYIDENYLKLIDKYDIIIRLTSYCQSCNELGVANLFQACNRRTGHCIVRDTNDYFSALTMAHELLHSFGIFHDNDKIVEEEVGCAYEHCLMYSVVPLGRPVVGLSMLTIRQMQSLILFGFLDCFLHKPEQRPYKYCGDYTLNNNEQCDCLDMKHCSNCCNTSTCKLLDKASCGHGACCNFKTCELYKSTDNHVCRPAANDCDLEEKCDGLSASCPPDLHMHDGWSCENGQGHCFNGECGSYHLACDKIFMHSHPGPDRCYKRNTLGGRFFNCGPPHKFLEYQRKAIKCEKEDVKCGRLHCSASSALRYSIKYRYSKRSDEFENNFCRSIYIYIAWKPNETDLGLVPNGAPCAPNKMCVNQKCIDLSDVIRPCPLNCQNRGKCTNLKTCLCNDPKDKSADCSFSPETSLNWQPFLRYFETTIQLIVMFVTTSTWIWISVMK